MKFITLICTTVLLSASLISCSQVTSTTSACNKAGYYADQTECQNSVSLATCSSTTIMVSDKNLVCWKSGSTSNTSSTDTGTTTSTSTNTGTNCSAGQAPPWTMGAWTPTACGAGVAQRSRTVTCDYTCSCDGTQPSTTETCTPNMIHGKHYDTECTAAGGTLEWIEGNRICKMSGATCLSGWTQFYYSNTPYTITEVASAKDHTNCVGGKKTVYTGSHNAFVPARMVESVSYCSSRNCFGCRNWSTLKAKISYVACY